MARAGIVLAVLLCTAALGAGAKDAAPAAADPALEARVMAIAAELRCLVCQNQTLADSDASLAFDLREQMRTMLRQGADGDQVRAFMTQRYGDFVLYRPPLKASTLPLWAGPGVLLLGGLAALLRVLRRRAQLGNEHFEADPVDATQATEQGVTP
jgi:cytochrome c-type biogenesis protein CcmH